MKKLLLIPVLLISILSFSQGIEFEHGTWAEVLTKAKQLNKPIFIDVYTSWCGPCKMMSKDIFPLEEVGKVYNEKFVCYKIDAEKGEGVELAKKYEVTAYPTLLFVKPDGTMFYKFMGSRPADKFIEEAKRAMLEYGDTKSMADWDAEYQLKKNDAAFLLEYMNKRAKLSLPNTQILEQYLSVIPVNERASAQVQRLYNEDMRSLKLNTKLYDNLLENYAQFKANNFTNLDIVLFTGLMNSVAAATRTKDVSAFENAMTTYDQLPKSAHIMKKDEVCMMYYQRIGNSEKYIQYASNYANTSLMKISLDSIAKRNKQMLAEFEQGYKAGKFSKMDSSKLADARNFYKRIESDRVARALNNIAKEVSAKTTDTKILKTALQWSERAMEIDPKNAMWVETYADTQLKLGKTKLAIKNYQLAMSYIEKGGDYYKELEAKLQKAKTPTEKTTK